MIPDPDDAIPLRLNQLRASGIALRAVLSAIDFDDQAGAVAREVGGEHPERNLKAEAGFREALAEEPPHRLLGIGCVGTEGACAGRSSLSRTVFHGRRLTTNATPTQPSPSRGRANRITRALL